ncbi:MAG TPA: UPF0175 family protein [Candidatus Methanomethylophilaceae archaeon]|nr:UPF0175 family protein [Candidatus Methanomethylophilaceae archaeon]
MHLDKSEQIEKIFSRLDTSEKIILFCMGALNKPLKSKVDVQKIVFLCNNELPEIFDGLYHFQAHKKGPYSEKIDEDVNVISSSGLVSGINFGLSDLGYGVYNRILPRVAEPLKSTIYENKDFIHGLSDDELLTFIYVAFPDYIVNSEEWGRLKTNRIKNAVSLLKKEKISASRAAEIAGMNYYDFEDYLKSLKVKWKS